MPRSRTTVGRTELGLRFRSPVPRDAEEAELPPRAGRNGFDFESLAALTFLQSLFGDDRRPHLLVQASSHRLDELASRIACRAPAPACICDADGRLRLPDAPVATLLIRDVSRLTVEQQIELADWMSASAAQVVSLSSVSLPELVEGGQFLQGLFDRLSAIQVNATRWSRALGRAS